MDQIDKSNGEYGSKKKSDKNTLILFVCILLFASSYFLSYCQYDLNLWDEGVPLSGALRMFQGDRPVKDFFAYPPGRYLLFYLSMKIFGISVMSPRILMAVISGIFCALVYLASYKLWKSNLAVAIAMVYLLMPMYYYYRFFTFALVLMLFMLASGYEQKSFTSVLLSGILASVIIWFRLFLGHIILLVLPVFCFWGYLKHKQKNEILAMTPTVVALISYICLILFCGGFSRWYDYLYMCLSVFNSGFGSMSLPWPPLWNIHYISNTPMAYLFQDFLFYFSGITIVFAVIKIFTSKRNLTIQFLSTVITAVIGFGLVVWRSGFGNLLRVLPVIVILFYGIIGQTRLRTRHKYLMVAPLLFLFAWDSLIKNPITYQSISIVSYCDSQFTHPRLPIKTASGDCRFLSEITSVLDSFKQTNTQTIFSIPFHPIFSFIVDCPARSYFEWILPGNFELERAYKRLIQDMLQSAPDVVVLNDQPFDDIGDRTFSKQYPELRLWLMRDYVGWGQVEEYQILRKKPENKLDLFTNQVIENASVSGVVQMKTVNLSVGEISCFSMSENAEVTVTGSVYDYSAFSSGLLFEDSNSTCNVYFKINDDEIYSEYISGTDIYELYLPFEMLHDSSGVFTFGVRWKPDQNNGAVSWINPVIIEDYLDTMIIDNWCSPL